MTTNERIDAALTELQRTRRTVRALRLYFGALAVGVLAWSLTGDWRIGALATLLLGYALDLVLVQRDFPADPR